PSVVYRTTPTGDLMNRRILSHGRDATHLIPHAAFAIRKGGEFCPAICTTDGRSAPLYWSSDPSSRVPICGGWDRRERAGFDASVGRDSGWGIFAAIARPG